MHFLSTSYGLIAVTSRHMGSGLLPENVTSLLKPDLMFPQYSSFTKWEVVEENSQHANLVEVRFCNLFSNQSSFYLPLVFFLIKTWAVFSSITHVLLRFHFTSSPGRLYAKQLGGRPDAPCQLTLHPAGCLTMQSAPHLWPDQLHSQFYHKASKKARNAVKNLHKFRYHSNERKTTTKH